MHTSLWRPVFALVSVFLMTSKDAFVALPCWNPLYILCHVLILTLSALCDMTGWSVLARIARLCGVVVQLEPRIDGKDKSRGDGHLYFHTNLPFLTHVIDPCAKYVVSAQAPLGAATTG